MKLGAKIKPTTRLQTALINRANHLRGKFSGSANRQQLLQKDWELHLEDEEVRPELQSISDKIEDLEDELTELRHEVSYARQDLKELSAERDNMEISTLWLVFITPRWSDMARSGLQGNAV